MQVIIDEIINNVRAVEKEFALSQEAMRQIVGACLNAVRDSMSKAARMKEEQSIEGPWATQPHGER
jgi:hypothetical protein